MTSIRASNISGYTDLLLSLGCDPSSILQTAGLAPSTLYDLTHNDFLSLPLKEILLETAAAVTGCEHFAALLGSRQQVEFLGLIAPAMQQSATVGQALEKFIALLPLHTPDDVEIIFKHYGTTTGLTILTDLDIGRHSRELSISQLLIIFKALTDHHWKPHQIKFSHQEPLNIAPFKIIFGENVLFNQAQCECIFASKYLDRPIALSTPNLIAVFQQQARPVFTPANDLNAKVEHFIWMLLPKGECSIETVAEKLSMHRRTLHRKLLKNGTSFTALLDTLRKKYATEELQSSRIRTAQLARQLGYADSTAFSRAFKRWHKMTPRAWKASQFQHNSEVMGRTPLRSH